MVYPKQYTVTLSESKDIEAILESSSTLSSLSNTCAWSEVEGTNERQGNGYNERDHGENYNDEREASFDDRYDSPSAKKKRKGKKKHTKTNNGEIHDPDETELMRNYQSPQKKKERRSRFSPRKFRAKKLQVETRDNPDEYSRTKYTRDASNRHVAIGVREGDDVDSGDYEDIELLDDRTLLEEIPDKDRNCCLNKTKKKFYLFLTFGVLGALIYVTLRFISQKNANKAKAALDLTDALPGVVSTLKKVGPDFEGPGANAAFIGGLNLMSVSMSRSGNRIAMGYPGYIQGIVEVYEEDEFGVWSKLGENIQENSKEDGRSAFGSAISMSPDGNFIAIANKWSQGFGERRGSISVYGYNNGKWSTVGNKIFGVGNYDQSGTSISLSENAQRIAIGSPHHDANGVYDSGKVEIFALRGLNTTSTWALVDSSLNGVFKGELFGSSVALSADGMTVAIGAPRNDDGAKSAGMVRILEEKIGKWVQVGRNIAGESENEELGASVSLSADGDIVAISFAKANGDRFVKTLQLNGPTWEQIGSQIKGVITSLSEDGKTIAVGSPQNDENQHDGGNIRILQFKSDDWNQVGNDIDDFPQNSKAGFDLKLTGDGKRFVIAAPGANNVGTNSGLVQVFDVI